MHILVVDDDPMAAELTAAILEEAGYDVITAEHGAEALECLNGNESIAAVISDMNMPLISGIDLFRAMRDEGFIRPFILLTGDDPGPLLLEERGLTACLTKDHHLETSLPQMMLTAVGKPCQGMRG